MNNIEISKALRSDQRVREKFVGVFSCDQMPEKEFPGFYVANTKPSTHGGEHWIAFYTPEEGVTETFDSFGQHPKEYSKYFQEWIGNDFLIMSNAVRQDNNTTTCGQYCMFFILLRAHGFKYNDVVSALTKNPLVNDHFVCKFVNKYFALKTTVRNEEFLLESMTKGIKELKSRWHVTKTERVFEEWSTAFCQWIHSQLILPK